MGPPAPAPPVPPLEDGDRLSRAEFERRYDAMPGVKKAELIEGVVRMPSPVRWEQHAEPHADLMGWLVTYRALTPGVSVGDNGTVRLDLDNEPQPDAAAIVRPDHGGGVRLSPDGYVEGAPDLVCEVAASTASFDLHAKLRVYRRNGVREYLVWRVRDAAVDWFALQGGEFAPLAPDAGDGLLRSAALPGLWLDPVALVERRIARVLDVARLGCASPEHAAFVRRLADARQGGPA